MARYALAEHVFICVNGDHLVFLDLKEDRYWALPVAQTSGIGALVSGWPVGGDPPRQTDGPSTSDTPSPGTAAVIEGLRERRILVADHSGSPGKDATPVTAIAPARELLPESETASESAARSWFAFVTTSAFAKFALNVCPFERVIARVRRRKVRSAAGRELDEDRARRLVEAFMSLRVFAFSSKNECLFDSLALLEFLARYGIYPDWVFAVQTRPFAAHCWVQHGDIVFNDTVENVSGYTPIMVV